MNVRIDQMLREKRVIVTCGTGGVGKTTLSSALAFRAALLGKKAVVVTIDPAKRLATSLGMKTLGDDPVDLTSVLRSAYSGELKGTVAAIMPDTRKTFELLAREIAPSPEVADRVMRNPLFQIFTKEFSGANEYMAMERLHALERSGQYDCIILDTPPSRNTLDFLNAPKLLAQLFEERMIRFLIVPTNRLFSIGMKKALGIMERLTGAGFMTNLVDFATGLFELQPGFVSHTQRVIRLLESPQVGFVLVTTPSSDSGAEVRHFLKTLREHHFHFDGVALNRTLSGLKIPIRDEPAFEILKALQARERKVLTEFEKDSVEVSAVLPELARDIHSVEDLLYVALAFDSDAQLATQLRSGS